LTNAGRMNVLIPLIAVLALAASAGGLVLFETEAPPSLVSARGETVLLDGRGLYAYDSVSFASQGRAQDGVTLVAGVPLLLLSFYFYRKGSGRGSVIMTGTVGYLLYTYASYSFIVTFNPFFLVYTALFGLSLFAFILLMQDLARSDLAEKMAPRFPRMAVAPFLFAVGLLILLMWLGRILPALTTGGIPFGLEHYSTLGIQVLDLGIVVPLCFMTSLLLFRRKRWGYLLSVVVVMKALTLLLAILAMMLIQYLAGVDQNPGEMLVFILITAAEAGLLIPVIRSVPRT